ncbi:tyrosine-type recombinase/integrase [Schauerella aestuarii]|uniref:tyrosine-type recombinase/integrase n=1 Tax=Schauerella aestuarii TaxID=2511204 RepID=UPI00136FA036|nr:DUF3596 domain-containing protein [Achromobacter aestuarii]MYZ44183.1 DUF3596 domain-containing protein [Achromobacter aestuarii]
MGRTEQFEGVYPRETSILVSFHWKGKRYRERVALAPTVANQRAAYRMRDEILVSIRIDKFTWDDFASYFPDSPRVKSGVAAAKPTFKAIAERWLVLAAPELAKTTYREYENVLKRYFFPLFGHRAIADIAYEDLAVYMAGLNVKSAKTFNNIMTPVRRVFDYAIKTKRVQVDITREIDSRRGQKPPPDPLDLTEMDMVLDRIRERYDPQWLNYFEFAFFTGCRPSELIALKWESVDFRRQQVRIEAARVRSIDKDTKTHTARDIDLQSRARDALLRQKAHTFLADGHVFTNPVTGERLMDTSPAVRTVWRPTLKAIGIRNRDARQTRHTFATMCLHANMNPGYISRQMGHTNARMFFEVYSKWVDADASDRERLKLDALFTRTSMSASTEGGQEPIAQHRHG